MLTVGRLTREMFFFSVVFEDAAVLALFCRFKTMKLTTGKDSRWL